MLNRENESLQRFEQAEKHRDGVRFKGTPRDTVVRITRYKNGAVVEIIEKHVKIDERVRKVRKGRRVKAIQNWPSKTAKTRAKVAKAKRVARGAALLDAAERSHPEERPGHLDGALAAIEEGV